MSNQQKPKLTRYKKTAGSGRKPMIIEEDHLIEALRKTKGFVMRAKDYLEKNFNYNVSHTYLLQRINSTPKLHAILIEERTRKTEDVLDKHIEVAKEGKTLHIMHVLEHWGHLVGYEKQQSSDTSVYEQTIDSAYNAMTNGSQE